MDTRALTRRLWLALAALTATVVLASVVRSRTSPGPSWRTDYAAAMSEAREQGRPAIVSFKADWCVWCARMDRRAWSDGEVRRLAARFVCVRVDADRSPDLLRQYGFEGLPAVAITRPDGRKLVTVRGYAEADGLARAMRDALARNARRQ